MSDELNKQLEEIRQAIAETEARLRELLPAEQLEAALAPLREQEATLKAQLKGSGAIAQGEGATALGERASKYFWIQAWLALRSSRKVGSSRASSDTRAASRRSLRFSRRK